LFVLILFKENFLKTGNYMAWTTWVPGKVQVPTLLVFKAGLGLAWFHE
jgi:hypothetical protein